MKKKILLIALICLMSVALAVPVCARAATVSSYEIYPNPHVVKYAQTTCKIPRETTIYISDSLDEATVNRAYDAVSQMDVLAYADNEVRSYSFYFGVYGTNDSADKFVKENLTVDTSGLFDKTDAYFLAINKTAAVVLGKDTNAAFYGLTTLKMIFSQVEGRQLRMVTIEDWSDSIYRGFIEGYYGIPWTTDERIELMRFGGDFKTNVYIYAPKNDPYHSTNWRSLYSEADLQEIKEQVKAGEQTKTRFVWAAHPFNHAAILPDDKYRSGIDALLAKFDQLYQVGVRQFVVSADDVDGDTVGAANRWNTDLARDILNDVANWCKKKGDCYNTIFVPNAYYTRANENNEDGKPENYLSKLVDGLDESVEIMWTGHNVCSSVSNGDFDKFTDWTNRKAFMWMNWPVNDYADGKLIMSKAEIYDVQYTNEAEIPFIGIVTNPMQYAEADKLSIFATADYTWNTGDFNVDKSYRDSFKYVEPTCSDDFYRLCLHMANASMFEERYFEESKELSEYMDKFLNDYETGNTQSQNAGDLLSYLTSIQNSGNNFLKNASNRNLVVNMSPYVESLIYKSEICYRYVSILQNYENWSLDEIKSEMARISELKERVEECTTHVLNKITYDREPTTVDVGVAVINGFIKRVEEICSEDIKPVLGMQSIVYKGFNGIYQGKLEYVFDGDENTFVWFDGRPQSDAALRIGLGELTEISFIKVLTGKLDGGDTWNAVVEYSVDGKNYVELQSISGASSYVDLRLNPIQAKFIRLRENGTGTWVAVREVLLNQPDDLIVSYGNIALETSVKTSAYNMIDGDLTTFAWFGWNRTRDAYVQLAYADKIELKNVQLLMAKKDTLDDYFPGVKLSYSLDGVNFTDIGEYTGRNIYAVLSQPVEAKYVRATSAQTSDTGIVIRDFSVNNRYDVTVGNGYKPYDYVRSGYDFTHVNYASDNDLNTFLDLETAKTDGDRTITQNLPDTLNVSKLNITSGGISWEDKITECKIEYSANGIDWQAIGEGYSSESGEYVITCYVRARYIRITVLNDGWITLKNFAAE